jgi:hypothetical protein
MARRGWIMIVGLIVLVGAVSATANVAHRTSMGLRGSYLYFDAANRPLNGGKDGSVRPLAEEDSARVTSRSFISLGDAGTTDNAGTGAMCTLQEPCPLKALTSSTPRESGLASVWASHR